MRCDSVGEALGLDDAPDAVAPDIAVTGSCSSGKTTAVLCALKEQRVPFVYVSLEEVCASQSQAALLSALAGKALVSPPESRIDSAAAFISALASDRVQRSLASQRLMLVLDDAHSALHLLPPLLRLHESCACNVGTVVIALSASPHPVLEQLSSSTLLNGTRTMYHVSVI